jgi:hypothetical protein
VEQIKIGMVEEAVVVLVPVVVMELVMVLQVQRLQDQEEMV